MNNKNIIKKTKFKDVKNKNVCRIIKYKKLTAVNWSNSPIVNVFLKHVNIETWTYSTMDLPVSRELILEDLKRFDKGEY